MAKVDREGSFKATVRDHGVGQTKENELPQLLMTLDITEYYEPGEGWQDYREFEMYATAYLVLIDKNGKEIFHTEDIKRVFGWDGQSFAALDQLDIDGTEIMIQVEENFWNDVLSYKVQNINKADDDPNAGGYKKLDKKALTSLDAKYGRKAKATPAKAKSGAKDKKAATPPKKSPPKKSAPAKSSAKIESETCSKDDAWDFINNTELWIDTLEDGREVIPGTVADLWSKVVAEIGDDEDTFTDDDWFIIREKIAKQIFVF